MGATRLDKERSDIIKWIESQRPKNTRASYNLYGSAFLKYAAEGGLDPKSPVTLASFMRFSLDRGLSGSTINSSITSAAAHIYRYDKDVNITQDPLVKEMKKVVKNLTPEPKQMRPLEVDHLRRMSRIIKPSFKDLRDYFMLLLMTVAMLRESEAVALGPRDVECLVIENEECLVVRVAKQTTKVRRGNTIVVAMSTDKSICPVYWFKLLESRRDSRATSWFHTISRAGSKQPRALSKNTPYRIVKKWLKRINIDPTGYGSHSCRRGGVTAAVAANVEMLLVARHGNWTSDAVFLYVSDSHKRKLTVSRAILGGK